jgi:hypothetical protein
MGEIASGSWFEGWQSSIGGRVAEFRKSVQKAVARTSRGGGAVGAAGLQVERDVQELANEFGRGLMREAFEIANTTSSEVTVCGETWGFQRVYVGTYETTFGEVSVARSTYQQKGKGRALIPLDLRLGMVEGRYSPLVSRIASRALGSMPTNEGEALLKEIGVCVLSRSTLHRLPQAMLARVRDDMDGIEERVRATDEIPAEASTVQVGIDGVMVPTDGDDAARRGRKTNSPEPARHEQKYGLRSGTAHPATVVKAEESVTADDATQAPKEDTKGLAWREASVGTVSFWDKDGELLKTIYLGEMPSYRKLGLAARLEREFAAVHEQRPDLRPVLASDGAPTQWETLREIAGRVLGDKPWTELLDFFHGAARLGNAAKAIWGTSEEATVIGEHWKTVLREKTRGAALVLKSLEYQRSVADAATAKELTKSINYLARHKKEGRLGYAAAKRLNLPIGTGVTEAAAKTLVSVRMKRSGARYSDHGGYTILTLRAAILSGRFDTLSDEIESTYALPVAAWYPFTALRLVGGQ